MPRVLFALDLGGGYGHLRRVVPLADMLATRGHEVVFALRASAYGPEVMGGRDFRVLPIPTHPFPPDERVPAENWADVLLRTGYARPGVLPALLDGWIGLLRRERPDLLLADFAPTALLAAILLGVRSVDIGSGFSPAPRTVPMPPTRFWLDVPAAQLIGSEARALAIVNAAVAGLGFAPFAALADTLAADCPVLACFPEFDHYGVRPGAAYFGNDYALGAGVSPPWPALPGPRVFAYLRAGSRGFGETVAALRALGVAAVVHARDLPAAEAAALSGPTLSVSAAPVRMAEVLAQCDVVVCHSPGTAAAALVAGRRVVMLPEHVEQTMVAVRLARQGLALLPRDGEAAAALRRALDDPGLAARAAGFAHRYHGYDPLEAAAGIVDECEILLRLA